VRSRTTIALSSESSREGKLAVRNCGYRSRSPRFKTSSHAENWHMAASTAQISSLADLAVKQPTITIAAFC